MDEKEINNEDKDKIKLSGVLICFAMLLCGFGIGINIGSQLFTESPEFINSIWLVVVLLCCIIIPFVRKREKAKERARSTIQK